MNHYTAIDKHTCTENKTYDYEFYFFITEIKILCKFIETNDYVLKILFVH